MSQEFGQLKVFEDDGSSWVQLGSDINRGNTRAQFGAGNTLSGDGRRVAGGTRTNPHYTWKYVAVYEYPGPAPSFPPTITPVSSPTKIPRPQPTMRIK